MKHFRQIGFCSRVGCRCVIFKFLALGLCVTALLGVVYKNMLGNPYLLKEAHTVITDSRDAGAVLYKKLLEIELP